MFVLGLGACATAPAPPGTTPVSTVPTPIPASTPTPTPPPVPTPIPTVPPPAALPTTDLDEPLIRVKLESTTEAITLPDPGRAWRVTDGSSSRWLWGPLLLSARGGMPWFQVGAFSEDRTAAEAARRLRLAFGDTVEVEMVDDGSGLRRVRMRWIADPPGDPNIQLAQAGFPGAFAVTGGGEVVVAGQGGTVASTAEMLLEPAGDLPAAIGDNRYRGRFRVRPSGGGAYLVINELNLERYLRGVVPGEMGPSAFPELAAIKAQTVAARTYAVAHLGDHDDEGYDICDTPACQVYHGVRIEHPMSNRAIEETSGLIAVDGGRPIDAMYSSTCGGHTDAAADLFPDRAQPYLQGVVCAWERDLALEGEDPDGPWLSRADFEGRIARRVLGLGPDAGARALIGAVASRTGGAEPEAPPVDVDSFTGALLEAGRLVRSAEVLTPERRPVDRLLFLADLYQIPLDPPFGGLEGPWPAAAALAVLELRGLVTRDHGEAVPRPDGPGLYPRRAMKSETLPRPLPLWERWREGYRSRAAQAVRPGTQLERIRYGNTVVALVVARSGGGGEADRRSAWRWWAREKPWPELARRLGILDLERLEITRRTDFGRVVGLAAVGRAGLRREWSGFEVRRALDLPDTMFTVDVQTRPDGVKVARFLGRGWGHGVGMCQNGAYGLARAGMTFDRILRHYYTGIQLKNWRE